MRKTIMAAAAATLCLGVAVPLVAADSKPEPTFRALEKPKDVRGDKLDLQGRWASLVVPGTVRFVGKVGKHKAYIAEGTGDRTCFLLEDDFGLGGGCLERESLRDQAAYVGSANGDRVDLLVPVPDAYEGAEVNGRSMKAADNVVLTTVPKKNGKLKVTGRKGTLEAELPFDPAT